MRLSRRLFLSSLAAAPLVAAPTLDEIARLGWKRRFFPGWSPPASDLAVGDVITISGCYTITGKLEQFRIVGNRELLVKLGRRV